MPIKARPESPGDQPRRSAAQMLAYNRHMSGTVVTICKDASEGVMRRELTEDYRVCYETKVQNPVNECNIQVPENAAMCQTTTPSQRGSRMTYQIGSVTAMWNGLLRLIASSDQNSSLSS